MYTPILLLTHLLPLLPLLHANPPHTNTPTHEVHKPNTNHPPPHHREHHTQSFHTYITPTESHTLLNTLQDLHARDKQHDKEIRNTYDNKEYTLNFGSRTPHVLVNYNYEIVQVFRLLEPVKKRIWWTGSTGGDEMYKQ